LSEDIVGQVFVRVLRRACILGKQGFALRLESQGNVPQENQSEDEG
jgi:hypothetical protein